MLLLLIICTACGGPDPNQVAPILFDVYISGCNLDPSGRYIDITSGLEWDVKKQDIYLLDTLEKPQVPEANERYFQGYNVAGTRFWIGPGVLFMGLDTDLEIATIPYYEDGWFFDFENQIFTDVLDLPPPERKALIEQTNAYIVAEKTSQAPDVSPDGRFEAVAGTIIVNNGWPKTGNYEEIIKFPGNADLCKHAWKPDGSGIYIVERTGFGGKGAGPVRFLKLPEQYLTPTPAEGQ